MGTLRALAGWACVAWAVIVAGAAAGQDKSPGEGAELAVGVHGAGPGQFAELRDVTVSPKGVVYTLEGVRVDNKTKERVGNLRVQSFDKAGKVLGTINLSDKAIREAAGEQFANDPQRLAVDSAGNVYVTQPKAKAVIQYDPHGKVTGIVHAAGALEVITRWVDPASKSELIVYLTGPDPSVPSGKDKRLPLFDQLRAVQPKGCKTVKLITLERPVTNPKDLTADAAGNFYVAAEPNAVYQFSSEGKLLKTLGGNPTTRSEDGSELLHTVAVDSKGNVYSMTWGNPGQVTRFAADGQTLSQRGGQWKWADPWSVHSSYVAFAIDDEDRLWVAVTNQHDPKGVNYAKYHASPAILRTKADFFESGGERRTTPTRLPGFKQAVACSLANNVSYEPGKPVPMQYRVAAANRFVDAVTVTWRAFDATKTEVGGGSFEVPLVNGEAANKEFSFTPAKFGAYTVIAQATSAKGEMGGVAEHVIVTPKYPELGELPAEKGGWNDVPRQIWSGLPNLRIHPGKDEKGLAKTDEEIAQAERHRVTFIVQLVDNMKHLTPEHVRRVVTRYKGRVPYYEICNEPNFSSKADEYFAGHKMAHGIIKEVDPAAKVMGPGTVNLDLKWLARCYELGFKDVTDAISLHDYEGHESVTPEHWQYKFGEIRTIMGKHFDDLKPIWQTERAIAGVRGNNFQGLVQAIRCTLHRDLLEQLGVPPAQNFHYYLNQAGYSSVPSYVWSSNGPHPAVAALRVRHALTAGLTYRGWAEFGKTGDTLLMGTYYTGADGTIVYVLRNLGSGQPVKHRFTLREAAAVTVTDAWGNAATVEPANRALELTLGQLPTYVTLSNGRMLTPERIELGENVMPGATWAYTAAVEKGEVAFLTDGVLETYHDANPAGGTDGKRLFTGALPLDDQGKILPQTLTATFAEPKTIDKMIVRTVRADNTFCTLLDFDVETSADGRTWAPLAQVRTPTPASERAASADAKGAVMWTDDTNYHVVTFAPTAAKALRIVAKRTTWGFVADDRATAWGKPIPPKLMLREIEAYGPAK